MKNTPSYGKSLLLITRIVLLAAGIAAGYAGMRAVIYANPGTPLWRLRYVYCIGTGVFSGIVLLLSARSFLWLVFTVTAGLKNLFGGARPVDAAAALIGLCAAALLTYLFDVLLSLWLHIFSLRVILDVAFAFVALGLCMFAAVKAAHISREEPSEEEDAAAYTGGYLWAASALCAPGAETLCRDWLGGDAVVADCTVRALIDGKEACESGRDAYRALSESGRVRTVTSDGVRESEALGAYAARHKLRIVAQSAAEFSGIGVPVLGIDELRNALTCDLPAKAIDETAKRV